MVSEVSHLAYTSNYLEKKEVSLKYKLKIFNSAHQD